MRSRPDGARPGRQREQGLPDRPIVERDRIRHGRLGRREQAPVEGGHAEGAGPAAAVGEPRDGLERFPQAAGVRAAFDERPQRLDGVAVPVDRMPLRDQSPGLGEQEEQDAVHDDE